MTNPVLAFTVAIAGLAELHVPPGLVDENKVVNPTQTLGVPLKVPALGNAEIVIVLVDVAIGHPPVPETE